MRTVLSWQDYVVPDYFKNDGYYAGFPPGSFVVDVGCGTGQDLERLLERGCTGCGTEVDEWSLRTARAAGRPIVRAKAEALPFPTGSADGVIFKGVLPYTDERAAFSEIARVLRPGGRLEALYLGVGFGLRGLVADRADRFRVYHGRSLASTVALAATGHRLPGWLGDTSYVTPRRLEAHYRRYGFRLLRHTPSPTYLGFPVFIYHALERVDDASGAAPQAARRAVGADAPAR